MGQQLNLENDIKIALVLLSLMQEIGLPNAQLIFLSNLICYVTLWRAKI